MLNKSYRSYRFKCFFAPHALACRRKVQRDLKILVSLRTAVLQVPSKSYENRPKRSGIVQLSRNKKKRKELKGPWGLIQVPCPYKKFSVPQAAPSKIAAVKPAAAVSAATPRTQRDSRTVIRTMVLQSAALIARNKSVVRRLHPSLKRLQSYLYGTLRPFKRAAGASSPLVSELL
jgi:hypothetical protein